MVHLLRVALTLLLGTTLATVTGASASAADPVPTTLSIGAPAQHAGEDAPLTVRLTAAGAAVAGAPVVVDRRVGGQWRRLGTMSTGADGRATLGLPMAREADDNVVRATYVGDASYAASAAGPVQVRLVRRGSTVRIAGPHRVVDERTLRLTVRWRSAAGEGVAGPVTLLARPAGGRWQRAARLRTDRTGSAVAVVRPRVDTRFRVTAPLPDWVTGAGSPVHAVDNLPPGRPVALPRRAPRPRVALPPQRRAVGAGPHAVVRRIPDGVWAQMTGRSWHRGCPVGRPGLRLVEVNYWDYTGYRRRGEVVVAAGAAGRVAGALSAMYRQRLPIRSMYRVDRFGWSRRLQGADDYRSMAAGNTSAFNCRWVVGRPGVRSPHSYGRSLDVNPWENPYRSSHGWVPNGWWVGRSHPRVAWRSRGHAVVRIMLRHGLRWTYGHGDLHHFDARSSRGRVVVPRGCRDVVCH